MAPFTVAALYHFVDFPDPEAVRGPMLDLCSAQGLCGTILLATEGINGTIAGSAEGIAAVLSHVRALPGCAMLEAKFSHANERPFLRMKVRLKREIVTMGVAGIDAVGGRGDYVAPVDWNTLIDDPDTIVIDTRNDYEVAIGSFEGAINPATATFRDFPAWFDGEAEKLREQGRTPKIAMFCTGGIRCEKATAYVKAQGFDNVFHLQGGILKYLEAVPAEQNRFAGDCFVFDQRVAVGHGLELSDYGQCYACRMPLSPAQMRSSDYVPGESCPHCRDARDAEQRARYRERQKQVELAEARGDLHLGSDC